MQAKTRTMALIGLLLYLSSGCSAFVADVAKSTVGLNDPKGVNADANLDVGAAVQLGKVNHNTKTSTKSTDRRMVSNATTQNVAAESFNQSFNVPWWAVFIAVLAGVLVDPFDLARKYYEMKAARQKSNNKEQTND